MDGDDDWVRKRTRKVAGPFSVCGDWRAIHPATSQSQHDRRRCTSSHAPDPGDGAAGVDPSAGEETRGVQRIRTRPGLPSHEQPLDSLSLVDPSRRPTDHWVAPKKAPGPDQIPATAPFQACQLLAVAVYSENGSGQGHGDTHAEAAALHDNGDEQSTAHRKS